MELKLPLRKDTGQQMSSLTGLQGKNSLNFDFKVSDQNYIYFPLSDVPVIYSHTENMCL